MTNFEVNQMTDSGYINLGHHRLHYVKAGSGSKVLLAFHGYGTGAGELLPIVEFVGEVFTVYAFDLPHHGDSEWTTDKPLEQGDLETLVTEVKKLNSADCVSLLGYSIGGRICLKIAEQMPGDTEKLVLVASDGLVFSPFHFMLTRTTPGKYLFRRFLENPDRYMRVIEWARRRNIIDSSRYKFAMQYLKEAEDRMFLLKVWPCLSMLLPDYKKLKNGLFQHSISVHLFMGKHDKIIPVHHAREFISKMGTGSLHVVERGHTVFVGDVIQEIAQALLS